MWVPLRLHLRFLTDVVQIAYFAAVPKADIISSGRIVAATFFRNMFGARAERVLSVFVALSAYGNVLSVIFSQGRCKGSRNVEGPGGIRVLTFISGSRSRPRRHTPFLKALGQQ